MRTNNMNTVTAWDVPTTYATAWEAIVAGQYTLKHLKGYNMEVVHSNVNRVTVLTGATRPRVILVEVDR